MNVYKYEIPLSGFIVQMHSGAKVLAAGVQGESIMVWARVDPFCPYVPHRFPIYGTGHDIEPQDADLPLVSTVFMGPMVFHVFDGGEI